MPEIREDLHKEKQGNGIFRLLLVWIDEIAISDRVRKKCACLQCKIDLTLSVAETVKLDTVLEISCWDQMISLFPATYHEIEQSLEH